MNLHPCTTLLARFGACSLMAVNSPVLLSKRLWSETRIALFERSGHERNTRPTVGPSLAFSGNQWVRESVLELFQEDISRQRIVIAVEPDENDLEVVVLVACQS